MRFWIGPEPQLGFILLLIGIPTVGSLIYGLLYYLWNNPVGVATFIAVVGLCYVTLFLIGLVARQFPARDPDKSQSRTRKLSEMAGFIAVIFFATAAPSAAYALIAASLAPSSAEAREKQAADLFRSAHGYSEEIASDWKEARVECGYRIEELIEPIALPSTVKDAEMFWAIQLESAVGEKATAKLATRFSSFELVFLDNCMLGVFDALCERVVDGALTAHESRGLTCSMLDELAMERRTMVAMHSRDSAQIMRRPRLA